MGVLMHHLEVTNTHLSVLVRMSGTHAVNHPGEPGKDAEEHEHDGRGDDGGHLEHIPELDPTDDCHLDHEEQDAEDCRAEPGELDVSLQLLVWRFAH